MTQRIDYQKLSTPGLRALGGVYTYIVNSDLPKAGGIELTCGRTTHVAKMLPSRAQRGTFDRQGERSLASLGMTPTL